MPRVPFVEQKTETRALPVGGTAPQLPTPQLSLPRPNNSGIEAVGRAQERLAESYGKVGNALSDIAGDMKRRGDQIRMIEAQKYLNDWQNQNIFDPNSGALSKKGKDAFGLPSTLESSYNDAMNKYRDTLANDDQRIAFDKMVVSTRNTILHTAYSHERQQMDVHAKAQVESSVDSMLNRSAQYFNDIPVVNTSVKHAQDITALWGRMNGLPQEQIDNQVLEVGSKGYLAALTRMVDTNPKGAIEFYKAKQPALTAQDLIAAQKMIGPAERKYKAQTLATSVFSRTGPMVSHNDMINFVMNDLEGGDKTVMDNNGAVAKFGINQAANPDIDVASLTPEQARAIYKERYWDKIDADSLPADARFVAFDAAVNHGPEFAKEIIEKSGGDAAKMLELRASEYERLAKADPEKYGTQLEGWRNRLSKVATRLDSMRGQLPTEQELYTLIDNESDDIDVAEDAKRLVTSQLKSIEDSRKQSEQEASREAWDYLNQGQQVPASVEARMNPKDVADMRKQAPADPVVYESVRSQLLSGRDMNLDQYRWQLGDKYDELVKIQQDPTKQVNARKVDEVIGSAQKILLGTATPKTPEDFVRVEAFRRAVDTQIDLVQKSTGKPVGSDEVEKITDRLLLNVTIDRGFFTNDDYRAFEAVPGEKPEIVGIPADRFYYVGGKEVGYDVVINELAKWLDGRNIPVNNESLKTAFDTLAKDGAIVQKGSR